jgi:predicted metal-dependent hydrolase
MIDIIIIVIFILVFMHISFQKTIKSNIDNRHHIVRADENSQTSADILAMLKLKSEELLNICKDKYSDLEPIQQLINKFHPDNITENIYNPFHTSYTMNKTNIGLCLKSKNGHFHSINQLFFVLLHELAHMMSKSIGHNDEFWENFKLLIRISMDYNLYEKMGFSKENPIEYCGDYITYEPI